MICTECGHEMRYTSEEMTETFRGMSIAVDGIERFVCDSCGNDVMSAEMATKLGKALNARYRELVGLLSPNAIKAVRKSIGMNQKEFETLLGVTSPTVSRWETGAMLQSKTADKLIRLIKDVPEAREYLTGSTRERYQTAEFSQKILEFTPSTHFGKHAEKLSYELEEAKEM